MNASRRAPARPAAREIDKQTRLGEVYMRSLLRSQLRLALSVLTATAVLLGGLPLLFALAPSVARAHVLGAPLLWLAARYHVRHCERLEAEFTDAVGRP